MDQVLPMVRADLGIGFYAEKMAARAIAANEVHQIRLMAPVPVRAVSLIEDIARPQSVAMKAFRRLLCEK